jgi:hypothetical protein
VKMPFPVYRGGLHGHHVRPKSEADRSAGSANKASLPHHTHTQVQRDFLDVS